MVAGANRPIVLLPPELPPELEEDRLLDLEDLEAIEGVGDMDLSPTLGNMSSLSSSNPSSSSSLTASWLKVYQNSVL